MQHGDNHKNDDNDTQNIFTRYPLKNYLQETFFSEDFWPIKKEKVFSKKYKKFIDKGSLSPYHSSGGSDASPREVAR